MKDRRVLIGALLVVGFLGAGAFCQSQQPKTVQYQKMTLPQSLVPYGGPVKKSVDTSTLYNKVICGYQGWFMAKGDGYGAGFVHWGGVDKDPPQCTVDLWPDLTEYDQDELFPSNYRFKDGSTAYVYSSTVKKTVLRHFKWMADYGIDGAFLQRFSSELEDDKLFYHRNKVLSSVREGANRNGITYAVMYDLSGTPDDELVSRVFNDWRMLREKMEITEDPAYQHHNGSPLVAVWGIGFNGKIKKRPDFDECATLIKKLKNDGCSVMVGTATGWCAQDRDASQRDDLHEMLLMADVISPWSVGRFKTPKDAEKHAGQWIQGGTTNAQHNQVRP